MRGRPFMQKILNEVPCISRFQQQDPQLLNYLCVNIRLVGFAPPNLRAYLCFCKLPRGQHSSKLTPTSAGLLWGRCAYYVDMF